MAITATLRRCLNAKETASCEKIDILILAAEFACVFIFTYFVYLSAKQSSDSFIFTAHKTVSVLWWGGAAGIGIIIPLLLNWFSLKKGKTGGYAKYILTVCVLTGAFLMRYVILLAGQMI